MSDRNQGDRGDESRRARRREALAAVGVAALATVVAAIAFAQLFEFVDGYLNGAFIDWVARQFLNVHNLNEFGIDYGVAFDSVGAKYFFFRLGMGVIAVVAIAAVAAYLLGARRRERETVARAAERLRAYMTRDVSPRDAFPDGFEELALAASEVKRVMSDHERALAEEAARKNDLITYLAHDLKTPLTSVIGYLSLLDEVPDMPAEQRCRYVGVTLDKARRLERLINEFFDITRYNLQHIELELAPVDLSFLLVQLVDEFYPLLAAHGNSVTVEVCGVRCEPGAPCEPLEVMADASRLARVLNNLLKNAIAYSDEGSRIEVWAQRLPGDRVRVCVRDRGVTIPPHKLGAIFDKFYRVDETRATSTGGAGLGLAIAREIVSLHGGAISATSERGVTTFAVELPVGGPGEGGEGPADGLGDGPTAIWAGHDVRDSN